MFEEDKFIEELNLQMERLDIFLKECDKKFMVHIDDIISTGLFETIDDVCVFFFSFDGEYFFTDVAGVRVLKYLYTEMLEELGINRLFYA